MASTPEEVARLKGYLAKLKLARYSGAKRVVYGDRDVTYKSDDDMRQVQRELEAEIAASEGTLQGRRRPSRSTKAVFRSGY